MAKGGTARAAWAPALLVAATLALGTPGCSFMGPTTYMLHVSASDPGAEIYVDGKFEGIGSTTIELSVNESHGIMARVGDRTGSQQASPTISVFGILDIVGGFLFLIPFVGLFAPGFWQPERDQIQIVIPAPKSSCEPRPRTMDPA